MRRPNVHFIVDEFTETFLEHVSSSAAASVHPIDNGGRERFTERKKKVLHIVGHVKKGFTHQARPFAAAVLFQPKKRAEESN